MAKIRYSANNDNVVLTLFENNKTIARIIIKNDDFFDFVEEYKYEADCIFKKGYN